jgi:hypothetical protein
MELLRPHHPIRLATLAAAAALLLVASPAGAFNVRVPQVGLCSGSLQSYLTGVGESINVATAQVDAQVWSTTVSGNADFTLMIELTGNGPQNAIGVYNVDDPVNPPLFQIFPGAATADWSAYVQFKPSGALIVHLYDAGGADMGQTNYAGVNRNRFGFYLKGPGGTFYSQDGRNGGLAQVLTYAGTGLNSGSWWQCFEDLPYVYPDCSTDFDDAVMFIQSVNPVPANLQTWGRLKALYR